MNCPSCSEIIPEEADFCDHCGGVITPVAPSSSWLKRHLKLALFLGGVAIVLATAAGAWAVFAGLLTNPPASQPALPPVAATPVPVAAVPPTDAPTYTPMPTYTPNPTYTPAPSYTPRPTLTPLPAYTPRPTLTPLPTYTPHPAPTLLPTYTPNPTLTPVPAPYLRLQRRQWRRRRPDRRCGPRPALLHRGPGTAPEVTTVSRCRPTGKCTGIERRMTGRPR